MLDYYIINNKYFILFSIIIKMIHIYTYYIGILIVFLTHFYTLYSNSMSKAHSIINIAAGLMIAYYFMTKEKYI